MGRTGLIQRAFFSLWYWRKPPWDTGQTPPEVIRFVEARGSPGRALDLGCGTGTNVIYLAQHGWKVMGVDFVPRAIRAAQRKARQAGVTVDLRVGDVTRLDGISAYFDLILDIGCFHSLNATQRVLYASNVVRLSGPGSTFLLYAFQPTPENSLGVPREVVVQTFSPEFRLTNYEQGTGRASAWYTFRR